MLITSLGGLVSRLRCVLAVGVLALSLPLAVFSVLVPVANVHAQTRIMCVGDSITEGFGGWASYRYPLWFDLVEDGFSVDFVGPWTGYHLSAGAPDTACFYSRYLTDFDRDHAGYSGWRTDQIASVIVNLATNAQPDVVLIHLGTNDIGQQLAAGVNNADANLRLIITRLRSILPNVTILLAKIIPRSPSQPSAAFVAPLNIRIAAIAAELDTTQSRIYLVDQNTGFDLSSMMQIDGLHPNTAGEQRIADVWRKNLSIVLGGPESCPAIPDNPPANSLIALYTFDDGTARDVTTSDNKTCVGFGNPQIVADGIEAGGMLLDGASYLRSDVLIHPSIRPQLTMGAWVRPATIGGGSTIVSHDNGGFDRTISIDSRGGGTGWSAFAGSGGGTGGSGVLGFVPAIAGQWQFVAVVYDATIQQVTLYVDGQVRIAIGNPGSTACGQNLFIGKEPFCNSPSCTGAPNANCTLSGVIDNVFIISEALSVQRLDEIRTGGYRRIPSMAIVFSHPLCSSVCLRDTAIFSVDAGGSGGVVYQWRKNQVPIDASAGGNPSATTATLLLSNVQLQDAGSYDCVVTNVSGSVVSNAATLAVTPLCPGDADGSGAVGLSDVAALITNWTTLSPPTSLCIDLDSSGSIGLGDLAIVIKNWGIVCR